ncbi:MAG: hypothetical protein ACHP65_04280, partial [Legionellales bacterium]
FCAAAISLPTSYFMENSYNITHGTQTVRHCEATKQSSGRHSERSGLLRGLAMTSPIGSLRFAVLC